MLVDITQIPYDEIKPNSILVIRFPSSRGFTEGDKGQLDGLTAALRQRIPESVNVLMMANETDVFSVDEELMNQMGWFKKTLSLPAPSEGAVPPS